VKPRRLQYRKLCSTSSTGLFAQTIFWHFGTISHLVLHQYDLFARVFFCFVMYNKHNEHLANALYNKMFTLQPMHFVSVEWMTLSFWCFGFYNFIFMCFFSNKKKREIQILNTWLAVITNVRLRFASVHVAFRSHAYGQRILDVAKEWVGHTGH
jgi:hypothetical protein